MACGREPRRTSLASSTTRNRKRPSFGRRLRSSPRAAPEAPTGRLNRWECVDIKAGRAAADRRPSRADQGARGPVRDGVEELPACLVPARLDRARMAQDLHPRHGRAYDQLKKGGSRRKRGTAFHHLPRRPSLALACFTRCPGPRPSLVGRCRCHSSPALPLPARRQRNSPRHSKTHSPQMRTDRPWHSRGGARSNRMRRAYTSRRFSLPEMLGQHCSKDTPPTGYLLRPRTCH